MKKITIQHFDKNRNNLFTERWTLRTPLTGNFEEDKDRLTKLVKKNAMTPHKKYATKHYVVSWGENLSFLLENK